MTLVDLLESNDHYHSRSGRGIGTDKEWRHKYCSLFYDDNFLAYKDRAIKLLEIGVGQGGGLLLWNDYFVNGSVYGIDVNDYTENKLNGHDRIHTSFCNAYDKDFIATLPNFDIIIDDGPHTFESHLNCLNLFLPKVKKGGMLVIEDIPNIEWTENYSHSVSDFKHEVIDTRNQTGLHDNIMFIVWK